MDLLQIGRGGIPKRWSEPTGSDTVLHKFTRNLAAPETLEELTDRTAAVAEKAATASEGRTFAERTSRPDDLLSRLSRNDPALAARAQDIHAAVELCAGRRGSHRVGW